MKATLPTFFRYLLMAFLVVACTKQVSLFTEVEFAIVQEHEQNGFLQESLPTTLSVVPEADLQGYTYSYTYEVSNGTGYFLDGDGEQLPSGEPLPFNPLSASLQYRGTAIGSHVVKITASDNFGFSEETELTYNIENVPVTWAASAAVSQVEPGDTVAITLRLQNGTEEVDVSFESRYSLVSGSGALTGDAAGGAVISEEFGAIVPGTYTLNFTPDALGTAELIFDLMDSNGQELQASVTIEVLEEVIDTVAPDITLLEANPQQVLLNAPYIESGATANDAIDGNLTDQIEIDATDVDTTQEDSYEVTYTVTDAAGNTATAVRTVIVTDVITDVPVTDIAVMPATAMIAVGATRQLTATVTPGPPADQNVLWSSSNTARATVSTTGLVTAVSAGNVTITAASAEDDTIIDTSAITVSVSEVQVSTITVNSVRASIPDNETEQFMAVVSPTNATNLDVLWSSTNPAVATVDPSTGLVNAVSAGMTSIVATATDGSGKSGAKTLTVTVAQIPVTSITVTRDRSSIPDNETEQFTAVVAPTNATVGGVTWSSMDTGVAMVDMSTGLVRAVSAGMTDIVATATDGSGTTGSATITVTASPVLVTGITVSSLRSSIQEGENENFSAAVNPGNASNPAVNWSSSDTSVATVVAASGVVTAISAGMADIIATATDGSARFDLKRLTVTANQAPIAVASASRTSASPLFLISFNANTSSDPDGDTLTYFWDFDDGNTSTEVNPVHSFSSEGIYDVTLTVSDNNLSATDVVTIRVNTPSNPDFSFSANTVNPVPTNGYGSGAAIELNFYITPNDDMPMGATYVMEMVTTKAEVRIGGTTYRERRNIPMNVGRTLGVFRDISNSTGNVSVTFTVRQPLTGAVKSRTLLFENCSGPGCAQP